LSCSNFVSNLINSNNSYVLTLSFDFLSFLLSLSSELSDVISVDLILQYMSFFGYIKISEESDGMKTKFFSFESSE